MASASGGHHRSGERSGHGRARLGRRRSSKDFLFEAVTYQSIGYFDPFPLLLRLDRVLQTNLIKLRRLRRILSVLSADRQRIRST